MLSENAKHVLKQSTQKYVAPPSAVFPLLCPVREVDWLDGWTYKMIYSESGFAEVGCIFSTKFPGEEKESIWVWTKHDVENHEVQFIKFVPDFMVIHTTIRLGEDLNGGSNARLIYAYTALNEKAVSLIENLANLEFSMISWMEKSINHYLKTGEKLVNPDSPLNRLKK